MTSQGAVRGEAAVRTYARLQQDIVSGQLPLDRPLLEDRLAERYGVSRTPVREALRRLEQDGLVERGSRGYLVHRFTPDEVHDIYETRILLEGHAARNAALRHGEVDGLRLQEANRRMAEVPASAGASERVEANRRFHRAIWESAGNRTVLDLLTRLYLHLVRHTTLTDPDRWHGAVAEHGDLVAAILARRPEDAERLMAEHLAHGRDLTLQRQIDASDARP